MARSNARRVHQLRLRLNHRPEEVGRADEINWKIVAARPFDKRSPWRIIDTAPPVCAMRDVPSKFRRSESGRPDGTRESGPKGGRERDVRRRLECCDANLTRGASQLREIEATLRRSLSYATSPTRIANSRQKRYCGQGRGVNSSPVAAGYFVTSRSVGLSRSRRVSG